MRPQDIRITILGAGPIGVSFAAALSDAGAEVALIEPDPARREGVLSGVADQRDALTRAGLWRGGNGAVTTLAEPTIELTSADMVLECGPERLETKQRIFAGLLEQTGSQTVLATASSAITMSRIVVDPELQTRCLVAHPVNPPAVLRLIELVPAAHTAPAMVERASEIFTAMGFQPAPLGREMEGFVLNRLQGAVLREAYRLVEEGVSDAWTIDCVMRLGLGPRWALSGPFETADLNTPGGLAAHARRMGSAYRRMGEERGETVSWPEALVARITRERRSQLPEDRRQERIRWRSRSVAEIVALRDRLERGWDG